MEYNQFDEQLEDFGASTLDIFLFLDRLRVSGQTNMFGAAPYIEGAFDVPRRLASLVLVHWMETFEERGCPGG